MQRHWIFIGAISAAIAVGLGALGAHGLEPVLVDKHGASEEAVMLVAKRMANWKTAALYQMHHSIGLIAIGALSYLRPNRWLTIAGSCFVIGITVFSGLLYALVLTEQRFLGAIVPIGGVSFILGWLSVAIGGCCFARPTQLNQN